MALLDTVPIIDISPFFIEGGDRENVVSRIRQACEEIGFFIVTGHGVDPMLIDRCRDLAREFFDLPLDEKMKITQPGPEYVRGYSALCAEGVSYSLGIETPPDLKESFSIGPVDVPNDPYYSSEKAGPHFAPNLWPDAPSDIRVVWPRYFEELSQLSGRIMRIFAAALHLSEDFFESSIDRHISMFRVLNYPEVEGEVEDGQLRAGEHSDYGSITILMAEDKPGGLQVRNRAGQWIDCASPPGAFVVNLGDLMMQWTNDRWISTMHRVQIPPADLNIGSRRISMAFFHQPNYDAMIECLPNCATADEPAKYAPITSGDHLEWKFVQASTFGAGKLEAAQ